MISTYVLQTKIIERCPVLIYSLCLVPKITVYSECGEWSVTLKQQTLHLRKISKSQWSHLLMFLTTRQLYFKWNISSDWDCAITFRSASSGKKDVILRPIVQMGKWSLRVVPNTWKYSGSASPGLHLWDLLQEGVPRQLSWDEKGRYTNLTHFNIKQHHPCIICWQKDVTGVLRDVQYGPVPEERNI